MCTCKERKEELICVLYVFVRGNGERKVSVWAVG